MPVWHVARGKSAGNDEAAKSCMPMTDKARQISEAIELLEKLIEQMTAIGRTETVSMLEMARLEMVDALKKAEAVTRAL